MLNKLINPDKKIDIIKIAIAYIVACFASMAVFFIGNNEHILSKIQHIFRNTNLLYFIAAIATFCLIFIACYAILQKTITKELLKTKNIPATALRLLTMFSLLLFLWLVWVMSKNSTRMIGYVAVEQFNSADIFLIISLLCLLVFIFRNILFKKFNIKSKVFWTTIAILVSALTAYFFYAPNGFLDTLSYSTNYDAYYNSIYIHAQGASYSSSSLSFYGHYAILLRPIFLITAVTPYSMAAISVIVSFVSSLSIIYVIYNLTKNTIVRLLGLSAVIFPFISLLTCQYPQAYPHRLLFPALTMALATFLLNNQKKENKKKLLLAAGYILSSLAIIWNSDTGIICLIAWGVLHIYLLISLRNIKAIKPAKILSPIIFIIASFLGAWAATDAYNIAAGGQVLNLYYFLSPLLENSYMYDTLHLDMPLYLTYWMPIFLIFMAFISYCILIIYKDKCQYTPLWLFIAVLGVGQFVYFINRCAYSNILLGYYEAILLLIVITQLTIKYSTIMRTNIPSVIKYISFYFSLFILIATATFTVVNILPKINNTRPYSNMSSLQEAADYYKGIAQKDTPIVSVDSVSLGSYLGWKNELGFTDLPNLILEKDKEYVIDRLINYKKPFLIDKLYLLQLQSINCKYYLDSCNRFKKISDEYEITNLNDTNTTKPRLLYLLPKVLIK